MPVSHRIYCKNNNNCSTCIYAQVQRPSIIGNGYFVCCSQEALHKAEDGVMMCLVVCVPRADKLGWSGRELGVPLKAHFILRGID